jgi:hypothetical protein
MEDAYCWMCGDNIGRVEGNGIDDHIAFQWAVFFRVLVFLSTSSVAH